MSLSLILSDINDKCLMDVDIIKSSITIGKNLTLMI